jgi:hypothetical protein
MVSQKVRRRRTIAAIVGILLIAGLIVYISARVAGSGPAETKDVELPADMQDAEQTSSSNTCSPSDLRVAGHTDALSYDEGEFPEVSLSIENRSNRECSADLGTATMVFAISKAKSEDAKDDEGDAEKDKKHPSDSDTDAKKKKDPKAEAQREQKKRDKALKEAIWRSTDCQKDEDHREVLLKPRKPIATDPVKWDRSMSSKDTCKDNREAVGPGEYELMVEIAGVPAAEPLKFTLAE